MSDQSSNRPLAGKAVTYKALGGPEVIEIVERTVRAPAAGEVRIEVKAAAVAVNPTDILFRDPGRSYSSIASVVRIAGSSSAVPVRAITSSGRPSISTPFVTAKSSKTPS